LTVGAEAIKVAENLVAQLQDKPDSKDYQTASQLLSELKDTSSKTNQSQPREA